MKSAGGRLGRSARAALDVAASPPVVGALLVLVLAVIAGQRGGGDDPDLGDLRRADAVESFVAHRFASEIARMKVAIAATAIALGLVIGLAAEALMRVRYASRLTRARGVIEAAVVCFGVHSALLLWAMADSPQLYAARWYAKGGLARTTQVFATDTLGPRGVVILAIVVAVLYMRPARIVAVARGAWGGLSVRLARKAAPLAVVLVIAGMAWRSIEPPRPAMAAPPAAPLSASKRPPNILILAADSLRADHLVPRVAPALSRLAERGARFDRAYVSIARTFPSWISILSGRHAHHHGIRSMFPTWEERAHDFDALPARLAAAGYATGVVSDYAGDIFGRIELGFERVDTPSFDFRQLIRQRALERETPLLPVLHSHLGRRLFPVMRELNDAADPMLLADDVTAALHAMKDKPFFLTVFFSTAHFPYAAPAPFYAKYTDAGYRGRFKYHKPVGLGGDAPPDAADIAQVRALYDGAVSAIDAASARVLEALEREGVADNTIVVITSDHGETLYDNGHGQGHGDHLFGDEGTHVPLVIFDPRGPPGRAGVHEARVVRDVDIAPTLYDLAGITKPGDLDGRSLAPSLVGRAIEPRFAVAETELWFTEEIPGLSPEMRMPYPGIMALTELDGRHNAEIVQRKDMLAVTRMARHRMIRDERWKLVYVPTRKGVQYLLFDTLSDPAESHDVAAANRGEITRLRTELWAWMLQDHGMEQKDGFLVPRGSP